jgi:AAA+ ATPase superfamily predicted ATPase
MFFGREKEIKTICQRVQSGDRAIVGGRRIGKSSVLQRANRLLNNDPRFRAIYIDCENKFNYEELFHAFCDECGQTFDDPDMFRFRELVTTLKGEDPARQVVFLLDEIDELVAFDFRSTPAGQLFKTFRALSHESVCRFVFSGSRTLFRHLHTAQSPFFNFCEDTVLKPLEERSIAEIVSKPMHQLGIELPEEEMLIDRIIDLSSSHPNIAQWLCDRLIKTISVRRITLSDLNRVSADPEFCRHYVETAWSDANPLERLISLLTDGPSFEVRELSEALNHHGLANKKPMVQESLETLELYSLLERQGNRYRFALSHFPRMVREKENLTYQIDYLLSQVEV